MHGYLSPGTPPAIEFLSILFFSLSLDPSRPRINHNHAIEASIPT